MFTLVTAIFQNGQLITWLLVQILSQTLRRVTLRSLKSILQSKTYKRFATEIIYLIFTITHIYQLIPINSSSQKNKIERERQAKESVYSCKLDSMSTNIILVQWNDQDIYYFTVQAIFID